MFDGSNAKMGNHKPYITFVAIVSIIAHLSNATHNAMHKETTIFPEPKYSLDDIKNMTMKVLNATDVFGNTTFSDPIIPGSKNHFRFPFSLPAGADPLPPIVTSANDNIASVGTIESNPVEGGSAELDILLIGGDEYGVTSINITIQWVTNGTLGAAKRSYDVTVLRAPRAVRVQYVLEYIDMGLCLLVLFFVGCHCRLKDSIEAWPWVLGCLGLRLVICPLLCLAFVELFFLTTFKKMGVLACIYSPVGLSVVPMTVAINGDLGLTATLVILDYLLANAALPLWTLQLNSLTPYSLTTGTVPFTAINVTFAVALLVYVIGLAVHGMAPDVAETLRKATPWVAGSTLIYGLLAFLISGADLFPSVAWKEIMLCIFWPLLLMIGAVVIVATCHVIGPKYRSSTLFLLVSGFYLPNALLAASLPAPWSHVSQATMFFYSLMTYLVGMSVVAAHTCFMCVADDADEKLGNTKDRYQDEMKLVLDLHGNEAPPSYEEIMLRTPQAATGYDVTGDTFTKEMTKASENPESYVASAIEI